MSKRTIMNDAAHWAVRMQATDVTAIEQEQFEQWLQSSSEHKSEYDTFAFLGKEAEGLSSLANAQDWLAKDLEEFNAAKPTQSWANIFSLKWAASAAVAGAIAIAIFVGSPISSDLPDELTYQTATGENNNLDFADGTKIALNTRTEIQVNINDRSRRVTLEKGEAFFDVAKDPERPFVVENAAGRITVLGTEFNVKSIFKGLAISVLEGRVQVEPSTLNGQEYASGRGRNFILTVGDQLILRYGAEPELVKLLNIDPVTSWQQQKLMFDGTPLADAIWEVNQYIDEPIEIDDPDLKGIRISGVFRTGESDDFIGALDNLVGIRTVKTNDGRVKLYAKP